MIDFRYHLVSIVAVFLAAAVGIVLGTTTLNGVVLKDLNSRVSTLSHDKDGLHNQLATAQTTMARDDGWAAAAAGPLIAGRLTGQRVAIVRAPGASAALRDTLAQAVADAGGEVTVSVDLASAYVDPSQVDRVGEVATALAPAGIPGDPQASPARRMAEVLAGALVRGGKAPGATASPGARGGSPASGGGAATASAGAQASGGGSTGGRTPGVTNDPTTGVLAGLETAQLLHVVSQNPRPATLALVVTGAPASQSASPSPSASPSDDPLLDLVGALDTEGKGAVVAGPADAAAAGGYLAAVRASGLADTVSTVDSVDGPRGLVAAVWALAAQPRGGAGAYGQAATGDAPLPSPAP